MNLILEKSSSLEYTTNLDTIFQRLPELRQYYWLISDIELNWYPDDRLKNEPVVIDGTALNAYVQENKIQFIWAVLSGFRSPLFTIPDDLPFADGNDGFWRGSPRPQAAGAELEIVCWDSTCTLFIGFPETLVLQLRQLFPDIRNLDEENERSANNSRQRTPGHGS